MILLPLLILFLPMIICLTCGQCDAEQRVGTTGLHPRRRITPPLDAPPTSQPVIRIVVTGDAVEGSSEEAGCAVRFQDESGRLLSPAELRKLIPVE